MEITTTYILDLATKLRSGIDIEEDKLDIKGIWYNLADKKGQEEICKDIAAMANTSGPTGYIIIGLNKDGTFVDSPFKESRLTDKTHLRGVIVKRVDLPPQFELKEYEVDDNGIKFTLSVISIPPSIDKPHVLSKYKDIENYIPVRKSTGTYPAKRSDIELMYYDRKNIEPEYALEIKAYKVMTVFNSYEGGIRFDLQLCFSNFGRKPIAIAESKLIIHPSPENKLEQDLEFLLHTYREAASNTAPFNSLPTKYLTIPSNHVQTAFINYQAVCNNTKRNEILGNLRNLTRTVFTVKVTDVNGKDYISGILETTKEIG